MLISTVINNKYRETNNGGRWEYTQPAPAINHEDHTFIKDSTAELTDNILVAYETCINSDQSHWMSKLAKDSMQYLADKRGTRLKKVRDEAIFNQSTIKLISEIFALVRSYAFQYNGAIGWNELYVTCTKPTMVTEVLKYNILREPIETFTTVRTRFSTSQWSLVVRRQANKIQFLLMPATKVIGLSRAEASFEPAVEIEGTLNGEAVDWQFEQATLTGERLEKICMSLFSSLVENSLSDFHNHMPAVVASQYQSLQVTEVA